MGKIKDIFGVDKAVIGMIHLSGASKGERIYKALQELEIYQAEGVHGAIIEDYFGTIDDVREVAEITNQAGFKIVRGINVLRNPYYSLRLARLTGCKFVQFDSVMSNWINVEKFNEARQESCQISIFGGVRFKYTCETGHSLEEDIKEGKVRCEAIVTTGEGTGKETPITKLQSFRRVLGDFPLVSGAGVTDSNLIETLEVADAVIVGTYFKILGNTALDVDFLRVRALMEKYNELQAVSR